MNAKQAKDIMIVDYLHAMGINPKKVLGDDLWYCSPLRATLYTHLAKLCKLEGMCHILDEKYPFHSSL